MNFSIFKLQISIPIFFEKIVGNTAKISTCISERIVQFLKLLLYYSRSNFLLGFLLLYLNEFRFFSLLFFLPMNCSFILFKLVLVQYSYSKHLQNYQTCTYIFHQKLPILILIFHFWVNLIYYLLGIRSLGNDCRSLQNITVCVCEMIYEFIT